MATIGLSHPYIARYTNAGSNVAYAGGRLLGKATELSIELSDNNSNILYADNAPAESDNQFSGGTISITTDDLRPQAMLAALGLVSEAISAAGVTTPGAAWLVSDDNQAVPYVGFGAVAMKKINGVIKYVGLVLDKVQFKNPNDTITTKGETIQWQVPQLSGTIFRSDNTDHSWKRITTPLDSEDEADAAVRAYLNITEASITPSLSALTIGALTLDPTFASGTTVYATTTTNAKDAVTATATNEGDDVVIKVNGDVIASGDDAEWNAGANTVDVTVTNSGGAQRTYIVTVTKSSGT